MADGPRGMKDLEGVASPKPHIVVTNRLGFKHFPELGCCEGQVVAMRKGRGPMVAITLLVGKGYASGVK